MAASTQQLVWNLAVLACIVYLTYLGWWGVALLLIFAFSLKASNR